MKKYKVIAVVLSLLLVFGFTTNYADAASDSVSKTIQQLKKQIKELTQSNKEKDKKIKKLTKDNAEKDKQIKNLTKENKEKDKQIKKYKDDLNDQQVNYKWANSELIRLSGLLSEKEHYINEIEIRQSSKLAATLNLAIENEIMRQSYYGYETSNITISTSQYYFEDLEKYFPDQSIKEMVIRQVRNSKIETVTIQFPTRNLIIKVNDSI